MPDKINDAEPTVEINEEDGQTTETIGYREDELSKEEAVLAKEHGLLIEEDEDKNDGLHKEQPEADAKEDNSKEEKEVNKDPDSFEDIDKVYSEDEKKFHKEFTSNQKALYFKHKNEKRKRQEASDRLQQVEKEKAELELNQVKWRGSQVKLDRIKEALGTDNLTIEQLQGIIDGEIVVTDDKNKPLTKADLERIEKVKELEKNNQQVAEKSYKARIGAIEEIGNAMHDNFNKISELANEVVSKSSIHQKVLKDAFIDESIDPDELVKMIVDVAKLSDKYKELSLPSGTEDKDKIDRVIKNSGKKQSSASVGSRGTVKSIPESELTCDQAARLTSDEWLKLSEKTRKRILMGIDP